MRAPRLLFSFVLALSLSACDEEGTLDAGIDAGVDAGATPRIDAGRLTCEPDCGEGDTCCPGPLGGDNVCYSLRNDPQHCGACGIDCVLTHRGVACELGSCVCGSSDLGCTGTDESYCCPPRSAGGQEYCANLGQDATNCGGCDRVCDGRQADRCDGGRCICGSERGACDGTPESLCCADGPADIGCVDTTTDRFHCGACGVLCQGVERCETGTCTRGAACGGGCALGEICCDGTCCERSDCLLGFCGGLVDAGIQPDAGPMDGGAGDAGVPDAGGLDGGVPDGG